VNLKRIARLIRRRDRGDLPRRGGEAPEAGEDNYLTALAK